MQDESAPRFYVIAPPILDAASAAALIKDLVEGGDIACMLLEFDGRSVTDAKKLARDLAPLVQGGGAALLARDPTLAARCGLDGAHISARDENFETLLRDAVSSLKPERIVGAGGVRDKHDAMIAGELGVDYVMFGEPAPDGAGPTADQIVERVGWWSEIFTLPCVAYASRLEEVGALAAAGADFIALGSALWNDPRGPGRALAEASQALRLAEERAP